MKVAAAGSSAAAASSSTDPPSLLGVPLQRDTYRRLATATYCTALFLGGCCVNIVGPAGPTLARSMHSSVTMIGSVFAAEGAGNTLGSSLISTLLSRYSGHTVVSVLCLLLFFAIGLVPSCTTIVQVVALYVVVGGCLGLINGASNTLVTWVHTGRNVGPWVNLINASFGLGASCAPLIFVAVERRVGNGLVAFSAIGAFATVPALAATLLPSPAQPPPPKQQAASDDDDDDDESARHPLRGLGVGHGASTFAGIDLGSRAAYVRLTVLLPLMLVITLVIGAEIAFAGWIYTYAIERAGMKRAAAAYLNSLFWTAFTAGRVATIPLAACLSPGMLLVPTLALEVGSVLVILCSPGSARCQSATTRAAPARPALPPPCSWRAWRARRPRRAADLAAACARARTGERAVGGHRRLGRGLLRALLERDLAPRLVRAAHALDRQLHGHGRRRRPHDAAQLCGLPRARRRPRLRRARVGLRRVRHRRPPRRHCRRAAPAAQLHARARQRPGQAAPQDAAEGARRRRRRPPRREDLRRGDRP